MKKLVLMGALAAILAVGSVSCSKTGSTVDGSALTTKIQNCTNPDSLKTYVDQAKEYADKLVKEGKVDEAKEYLSKLEPIVQEKAPALAGTLSTVEAALDKVSDAVSGKAEDLKEGASAAVDSVGSAVSGAKDAVSEKVGEVKDAVSEKAGEAKEAATQAVQNGTQKVKDLFNK